MTKRSDYSWMRVVLQSLFSESTVDSARAAIRSNDALALLRSDLEERVLAEGRLGRIPDGDLGDNLILALLSLRTKFERDEAFGKLEINISMRDRRSSPIRGQR